MGKVKQLADIETSKYTQAVCQETGIKEMILDIYKVDPEDKGNIQSVPGLLKDLVGAKLIFMEPIGGGADFLEGLLLYFMLPNGDQRTIEVVPDPFDMIDCIGIQYYKLDRPE